MPCYWVTKLIFVDILGSLAERYLKVNLADKNSSLWFSNYISVYLLFNWKLLTVMMPSVAIEYRTTRNRRQLLLIRCTLRDTNTWNNSILEQKLLSIQEVMFRWVIALLALNRAQFQIFRLIRLPFICYLRIAIYLFLCHRSVYEVNSEKLKPKLTLIL